MSIQLRLPFEDVLVTCDVQAKYHAVASASSLFEFVLFDRFARSSNSFEKSPGLIPASGGGPLTLHA